MKLIEQIRHFPPCDEAVAWLGDRDLAAAWAECPRADWMLWLYERSENYDKRLAVQVAALIANDVRLLMADPRSTACVDMCLAYGRGEASDQELAVARIDAQAAAWAVKAAAPYAGWYAARAAAKAAAETADAADAAAWAADAAAWAVEAADAAAQAAARNAALAAAEAAEAADAAAWADAWAAWAADAAARAAAWAAAWAAALKRYADFCREHLPVPEINPPAGERRGDE